MKGHPFHRRQLYQSIGAGILLAIWLLYDRAFNLVAGWLRRTP